MAKKGKTMPTRERLAPETAIVPASWRSTAPARDDPGRARGDRGSSTASRSGLEQAGAYAATERIGFARYLALWRESRAKALDVA